MKTLRVELEGASAPPGKEERNTRCPGSAACPAPSLCAQRDAGMAFAAATKWGPGCSYAAASAGEAAILTRPGRSSPRPRHWGRGRGGSADPLDLAEV